MKRVLAVAAGTWLLVDLLRVWAPSLITIFGQAASTPAELMGAFALAVVLAGLLPLLVVRFSRVDEAAVMVVALLGALLCRVLLQVVGGGDPQLWWSSAGVACAVAWLCLATRCHGPVLVEGYAVGLALATTTHAALGTWGAVWRDDVWAWLVLVVQVGLVGVALQPPGARASAQASPTLAPASPTLAPASPALAFWLLPSYLLAGTWAANPGRASSVGEAWGLLLVVAGGVAAVGFARRGAARRGPTLLAGLVMTGATVAVMLPDASSAWALPAFAVGMPALVIVLSGLAAATSTAAGRLTPLPWAGAGAVLWVLLFFAYYAGYDLGYRADLVLVVLAAVLTIHAVRGLPKQPVGRGPGLREPGRESFAGHGGDGSLLLVGLLAVVAAGVGPALTTPDVDAQPDEHDGLRVMAWNLRMGYGIDGTFEPRAVAGLIADQHPDVVLLSEIDRAWLLNGGQDQLAILARLLGMEAHFSPAADPVWGDAVLTDLPVSRVDAHPLPSYDAVTGAQALALTVERDGTAYDVISTHVQPHGGDGDGSLEQARDLAELARERGASGRPLVMGGDFNLQPADASWDALIGSGLTDALHAARPLPTSPADDPEQQIDHVFISRGLVANDPRSITTRLSDHLPVVVTVIPVD